MTPQDIDTNEVEVAPQETTISKQVENLDEEELEKGLGDEVFNFPGPDSAQKLINKTHSNEAMEAAEQERLARQLELKEMESLTGIAVEAVEEEESEIPYISWEELGGEDHELLGKEAVRVERILGEDYDLIQKFDIVNEDGEEENVERKVPQILINRKGKSTIVGSFIPREQLSNGDLVVYLGKDEANKDGDFEPYIAKIIEKNISLSKKPVECFDDVGGLETVVEYLKDIGDMFFGGSGHKDSKVLELVRKFDVNPPRGILFYGPPGTGKTLLAKAFANYIQANFYFKNAPELITSLLGETAQNIRDLYNDARRNGPSVVYLDEATGLIGNRRANGGGRTSGAEKEVARATEQLQAEMDGLYRNGDDDKFAITIASTNIAAGGSDRIEEWIDPAMKSRYKIVKVPLPDPPAQRSILKKKLRNIELSEEVDLDRWVDKIADLYDGQPSGRNIQDIIDETKMIAIREQREDLSNHDFETAVEKYRNLQSGDNIHGGN